MGVLGAVRCILPPSCEDCALSSPFATVAAMHLMYYTNEEGHRVYTLKVLPSTRRLTV